MKHFHLPLSGAGDSARPASLMHVSSMYPTSPAQHPLKVCKQLMTHLRIANESLKNYLRFAATILLLLGVGQVWGTSYISYNGNTQDGSTTISTSNVSSGSAGKISWTGTNCTYSSSRVNIAANGSITFTAASGCCITKIVIVSGSSEQYYGTWTSSPSVTPTSSSGTTTFDGLSANSVTVTTSTAFRCTNASSIKIYYSNAYSVEWTINPSAGGTLTTTSGTSTTVILNTDYTYGSPAYTITSGTANVSQNGNVFSATPSSNCSIRINLIKQEKYTITFDAGTGTCNIASWTQPSYGASTTLPVATPPATCSGWSFAGWCTSSAGSVDENSTSPGDIITTSTSYKPTNNVTLYAVYTRTGEGSGNDEGYYVTTTLTAGKTYIFGAVKAAASASLANNTTFGAVAFTNTYNSTSPNWGAKVDLTPNASGYIAADNASITDACLWTLESITSGNYSFKNGNNYIYLGSLAGSTSNGAQSGVNTSGNMYLENVNSTCKDAFLCHPASNSTNIMLYNTSSGYRMYASRTYSNTMTPYVRFYEYDSGSTTYYMTNLACCTPLGAISGSVDLTQKRTGEASRFGVK